MTPREEKVRAMLLKRYKGLCVVLEDIHDPHNAAAIMRTCDALGIHDVRLVFVKEKPWNPKRIGRASSSSANKWLSFTVYKSLEECLSALDRGGFSSVATVLQGKDAELAEYDFTQHKKVALWVGNEHSGLSARAREYATVRMNLPMKGMVESLNVSVATALFLYELTRQWRSKGDTLYTEEEIVPLAQDLLAR